MAEVMVIARARDEASAVLRGLQQNMKQLLGPSGEVIADWSGKVKAADTALLGLDASATRLARSASNLAFPIASQLSPAFGALSGQLTNVVMGASLVTGALGITAVAGLGLAAIVGGKLLESWQKSGEAAKQFSLVLGSMDIGKKTSEIARLTSEIEKLDLEMEDLDRRARERAARPLAFPKPRAFGFGDDASATAEERQKKAEQRTIVGEQLAMLEQDKALVLAAQTAAANRRAQLGLMDFMVDPATAAHRDALRRAAIMGETDPAGAERLRGAAALQLRFTRDTFWGRQSARPTETALGDEEGLLFGVTGQAKAIEARQAADEREQAGVALLLSNVTALLPATAAGEEGGAPFGAEGRKAAAEALDASEQRRLDRARLGLDLDRQRADLLTIIQGASQAERDAIEGRVALLKTENDLAAVGLEIARAREAGDQKRVDLLEQQKGIIQEASTLDAAMRGRRIMERDDPIAAIVKGFQDAEDVASNWGTRMQALARDTSAGMTQTFSDGFFSVLTGQFAKLPDVARQFGQAMIRTLTNELAAAATAPILRSMREAMQGLQGSGRMFAGAPLLGDLFAGGGTGGAGAVGGALPILVGGKYLAARDVAIAQAQAGSAGVQALASGEAVVAGGQFIGNPSAELLEATGRGGLYERTATGFTFSQGLGLAATGALYALSLYSASQARTTSDLALNTGLGALQGALIGYQLGGDATSSAVGALVAAALSAGASAWGKRNAQRQERQQRQAAEVQRSVGAAGDLVSEANRAQSIQGFFDALTRFGSGYTGGTSPIAVSTSVDVPGRGRLAIGTPNPTYPVAGVEDLFAYLPTLQAGIQAGVAPGELAAANEQASLALRERGQQLLDDYNAAIGGVDVFAERSLDGVTERTTVPGGRASALEGQALFASQLGIAGLSDDDKEMFLRDLIRVAGDRGLRAFMVDPETDQIVSLANLMPGGMIPPPGPIIPPPGTVPPPVPLPAFSLTPFAGTDPGRWNPPGWGGTEFDPDPERAMRETHATAQTAFAAERSAATRQQLEAYFAGLTPQQLAQALSGNAPEIAEAVARLTPGDRQALGVRLIDRVGADAAAEILGGDPDAPGPGPGGPGIPGTPGNPAATTLSEAQAQVTAAQNEATVGRVLSVIGKIAGLVAPASAFGAALGAHANLSGVAAQNNALNALGLALGLGPGMGFGRGPNGTLSLTQALAGMLGQTVSGALGINATPAQITQTVMRLTEMAKQISHEEQDPANAPDVGLTPADVDVAVTAEHGDAE